MTSRAAAAELVGIVKRFGSVAALSDVSLSVRAGEFFALLGPSGCGKTTLLRVVAGFESPDSGRVLLDGRDITALRPSRRPVNLMFQSYALFPHMTVFANIAYGLEAEGIGRGEVARRTGEAMETAGLSSLGGRKPETLSGGQRQRVALARALVKRPRVLLLDEPLAALDRKLRGQMQFELKRMQNEAGVAFVVVTHDQEEAMAMADRIAVMNRGRVEQVGEPPDLYDRPRSRFVAEFIGDMNFFEGEGVAGGILSPELGLLRCASPPAGTHVLAVRPERVRLSSDPERGANVLRGVVLGSAYRGQDVCFNVAAAPLGRAVLARVPAHAAARGGWRAGDSVCCCWGANDGIVIESPGESGRAGEQHQQSGETQP